MTRPTSDDEFSDLLLALRFGDEPGARASAHAALVYVQNLRAAVRAADAMAKRCSDELYRDLYAEARAKCGEVT